MELQIENGVIPAKYLLGRRDISNLRIQGNVKEIGKWAFSHMKNLRSLEITVYGDSISIDRGAFESCENLEKILLYQDETPERRINGNSEYLLADAMVRLSLSDMLRTDCGSPEWMALYDAKLLEYLDKKEDAGFDGMWFGGEEDYDDTDTNIEKFTKRIRMEKIAVIYHRLIENAYLDLTVKRTLYQYLKNHTIGFGTNDNEAFDLIVQSHRNDLIYLEKFAEAGCITEGNRELLIECGKNLGAEMKAYILSSQAVQGKAPEASFDKFQL